MHLSLILGSKAVCLHTMWQTWQYMESRSSDSWMLN